MCSESQRDALELVVTDENQNSVYVAFGSRRSPLATSWTSQSGITRFPGEVCIISYADLLTLIDLINSKTGIKTGCHIIQNSEGKALGGQASELSCESLCERDQERDPFVTTILSRQICL